MNARLIDLRVWKHSHGGLKDKEREKLRKRSVITLFEDTGKEQGLAFREQMQPSDFFYLCYGNRVQLFGQITSNFRKGFKRRWVERAYRIIKECSSNASKFTGPQKKWTPNFNSTCALVPTEEQSQFERATNPSAAFQVSPSRPRNANPGRINIAGRGRRIDISAKKEVRRGAPKASSPQAV